MNLIERLRKSRHRRVEAGGHAFTVRRPTDLEMVRLQGRDAYALLDFVVGWDLHEIDLVPGGSAVPAPFDAELWREWVADHPHLWQPLIEAVQAAWVEHAQVLEDAAKN